jgi:hypothetical protein
MESEQRQPRHRGEQNESESRMRAFEAGISDGNGRVVIAMTASSDTPNLIQRCAVFGEPRRMRNDMRPSFEARQARTSG